jgi:enoyl-CoA hydratase/carnithine racemase
MIGVEHVGTVAIVKLSRSVTNPIDLDLVNELGDAVERLRHDARTGAIVLSSASDKFFSIGWNIPDLYPLEIPDFRTFYQAFNRLTMELYTLAKPTVAAITGHATAGGCILPLCCDWRVIAEGRKLMGLNEVLLGVPVPYPGDRILRDLVGARAAGEVMEIGAFYEPPALLEMGMVNEVVPLDEVRARAVERARYMADLPASAYSVIKRNRTEVVEAQVRSRLKEKEDSFLDLWYSPETRKRLEAAMERF